jgi:hypothetical protein
MISRLLRFAKNRRGTSAIEFFNVPTSAELQAAFHTIANDLSNPRVSQSPPANAVAPRSSLL